MTFLKICLLVPASCRRLLNHRFIASYICIIPNYHIYITLELWFSWIHCYCYWRWKYRYFHCLRWGCVFLSHLIHLITNEGWRSGIYRWTGQRKRTTIQVDYTEVSWNFNIFYDSYFRAKGYCSGILGGRLFYVPCNVEETLRVRRFLKMLNNVWFTDWIRRTLEKRSLHVFI